MHRSTHTSIHITKNTLLKRKKKKPGILVFTCVVNSEWSLPFWVTHPWVSLHIHDFSLGLEHYIHAMPPSLSLTTHFHVSLLVHLLQITALRPVEFYSSPELPMLQPLHSLLQRNIPTTFLFFLLVLPTVTHCCLPAGQRLSENLSSLPYFASAYPTVFYPSENSTLFFSHVQSALWPGGCSPHISNREKTCSAWKQRRTEHRLALAKLHSFQERAWEFPEHSAAFTN